MGAAESGACCGRVAGKKTGPHNNQPTRQGESGKEATSTSSCARHLPRWSIPAKAVAEANSSGGCGYGPWTFRRRMAINGQAVRCERRGRGDRKKGSSGSGRIYGRKGVLIDIMTGRLLQRGMGR